MEMGAVDIKEHLLQSDEDFRRLAQKHHQYDEQLDKLIHKSHLSEEEKVEEVTLKKKLQVKDQMESMILKYRQQSVKVSAGPLKS
ncbi:MAG: DUF465 domain-containing protein [Acidobacteria bacterium]|nr:DUF465 domain-containing protein [Acidobacteriota bacterium]